MDMQDFELHRLLEESRWNLADTGLGSDASDGRNTKAQAAKVRPGKQDYAEPQAICLAKQSINRVKSQPAEREKTFANHAFGAHIQNRQWIPTGQRRNRTQSRKNRPSMTRFSKDVQMANSLMKDAPDC